MAGWGGVGWGGGMGGDLVKKVPGPPGVDFSTTNRLSRIKESKSNTSPPPLQPPPTPPLLPPPLPPLPSFPFNFLPPPPTNQIFSP